MYIWRCKYMCYNGRSRYTSIYISYIYMYIHIFGVSTESPNVDDLYLETWQTEVIYFDRNAGWPCPLRISCQKKTSFWRAHVLVSRNRRTSATLWISMDFMICSGKNSHDLHDIYIWWYYLDDIYMISTVISTVIFITSLSIGKKIITIILYVHIYIYIIYLYIYRI